MLVNTDGTLAADLSYDAWGRRRNAQDWSYNSITPCSITDRGYCMHEHLDAFNLINMNGRMYDPILGRMLNPDPVNQNATCTQNYNKYSYCNNNPLKYTDPSGNTYLYDRCCPWYNINHSWDGDNGSGDSPISSDAVFDNLDRNEEMTLSGIDPYDPGFTAREESFAQEQARNAWNATISAGAIMMLNPIVAAMFNASEDANSGKGDQTTASNDGCGNVEVGKSYTVEIFKATTYEFLYTQTVEESITVENGDENDKSSVTINNKNISIEKEDSHGFGKAVEVENGVTTRLITYKWDNGTVSFWGESSDGSFVSGYDIKGKDITSNTTYTITPTYDGKILFDALLLMSSYKSWQYLPKVFQYFPNLAW